MNEHLRTDYDRMVGESYKEYASRCRGRMLAAEQDRDELADAIERVRALCEVGLEDSELAAFARLVLDALDGAP